MNTRTRRTPRKRKTEYDVKVVRQAVGDTKTQSVPINMEAAASALYANFIRVFQLDIGITVDGRRKSPAPWDGIKEFQRKNWREVAKAVVDAATGVKTNTA